jgi:cell shape-determining protein MreC
MVVYRRETRRRPVLLIVAVVSLVLVTLDSRGNGIIDSVRSGAREALQPVQSVVDSAFEPVRNAADGITGYGALKDENATLRCAVRTKRCAVGSLAVARSAPRWASSSACSTCRPSRTPPVLRRVS